VDDRLHLLVGDRPRATGAALVVQTVEAPLTEADPPARNRMDTDSQTLSNGRSRLTLGTGEDDFSTQTRLGGSLALSCTA
ncbi:hypothetical protein SB9_08340, partial [Pseudomonas oryzihabitans]